MSDDLGKYILEAHERSFERAFETAVRTDTALVFSRNGKIVEVKPPYRYELVPIKPAKKKKATVRRKKCIPPLLSMAQIWHTGAQKQAALASTSQKFKKS